MLLSISLALSSYVLNQSFAFSENWKTLISHIILGYITTLFPILFFYLFRAGKEYGLEPDTPTANKVFILLTWPLLNLFLLNIFTPTAIGAHTTVLLGKPCKQIVTAEKKEKRVLRRPACIRRLVIKDFKNRFIKPTWCISKKEYLELPQISHYLIKGKKSFYGFTIEEDKHLPEGNLPKIEEQKCYDANA